MTCSERDHDHLRSVVEDWERLRFVGYQADGDGGWLELRQCGQCMSSLAVVVDGAERVIPLLASANWRAA